MSQIALIMKIMLTAALAQASAASSTPLGYLNWGPVLSGQGRCIEQIASTQDLRSRINHLKKDDELAHLAKNVLNRAKEEINEPLVVAKTLEVSEHPFFFQKEYKDAVQAGRSLKKLMHFAICARLANEPLAKKCQDKAGTAIHQWIAIYKPTGQPIDESALTHLFEAIDLMQPLMPESRSDIQAWLRDVIAKSDDFFENEMRGHDPADKNWNTWRMAIRALASTVLNDSAEISKSSELIHKQIHDNFVRDERGHTDGTSLDFIARDALHYHIYDMLAWVTIADFTPCFLTSGDKMDIESGLDFLKPYYLGTKQHTEFSHTRIQEDRDRGNAGDLTYRPHIWSPNQGEDAWMNRALIRWARPAFPAIRSWTRNYVDTEYDSTDKFLAKLWGEPEVTR